MVSMRSPIMTAVVGAALLVCMTVPAVGQTVTTGAINGRVRDTSGADMPGVSVTIKSPNLIGVQTDVTTADGGYRFPSVPPGDYQLTFELAGFGTLVREGIRVGANFTATVNVELAVAGVAETVTVTGASPVVDVQATKVQTSFTSQQLESLPGARDMGAILSQTPGVRMAQVVVGGNSIGSQFTYAAYGGGPNRPTVEGLNIAQGASGGWFIFLDYGSFEEVVVNTAGHGADMGVPGVQTQFIVKSGGNKFKGAFLGEYQREGIQSHNVDAAQIRLRVLPESNRLHKYDTVRLDSGGPIRVDKIWWYAAYNRQDNEARLPTRPVNVPAYTRLWNPTGKITAQLSKTDTLIGFYQGNQKDSTRYSNGTRVSDPISPSGNDLRVQTYYGHVWKGEWDHVVNDQVFFELRAGQIYYWNEYFPVDPTLPGKEDLATRVATGAQLHQKPSTQARDQVIGNLSLFKHGWGGSHSTHNFKVGGEFFKEYTVDGLPEDHVTQYFNNGTPVEVQFWQGPSFAKSGAWVGALHGNDAWAMGSKVTLNVGGRYDLYQAWLPEQSRVASRFSPVALHYAAVPNMVRFNMFAPRAGVAYDVTGDGRTVVKVNVGKYWWTPSFSLPAQLNPNAGAPFLRYTWTDQTGNGVWDPGEEGRLTAQGGGSTIQLDPTLKDTYSNEVSTTFERELATTFGLRAGLIWRGHRQQYRSFNSKQPYAAFNVPITVIDPGPDGKVGTADDGAPLTLYNLDPTRLGTVDNRVTNVRGQDDYYTFELSATRRKVGRFNLVADYSQTWAREGAYSTNLPAPGPQMSPNDLVSRSPDGRSHTTTWQGKVHGTIDMPWSLRVTPLLRYQSGDPFGRTFVVVMNYGTQTVLAEPRSTRRVANTTDVDVRVERIFQVSQRSKISAAVDLYNLFNANPEGAVGQSSGATFLQPINILPPRIVRFGMNLSW